MPEGSPRDNRLVLAAGILSLLSYAALVYFRYLDDNRLTSWKWAFQGIDPLSLVPALVAGVLLAYGLSGFSLYRPKTLALASFLLGAIFWPVPECIVDSARYFTQAKHLELYGTGYFLREWGEGFQAWTDLPAIPFLYGLVFRFVGETRLYIQVLNTAFFSLSVYLTVLLGRQLWDERTGALGGVFMLAAPFVYTQVPLMLVDVGSMFFLLGAVYAFLMAVRGRGILNVAIAAGALSAAALSKYSMWLMLTVIVVVFLVVLKEEKERRNEIFWRGLCAVLLGALAPLAFFLYKHEVFAGQMALLQDYQRPGLERWTESFASTFLFQVHPFVTASAIYSIYVAIRKKDVRFAVVAWLMVLVLVLQIKRSRYVLPALPMLALMASYGISQIRSWRTGNFIVLVSALASIAVGASGFLPLLKSNELVNLKHAGRFLEASPPGDVEVLTLPQQSSVNPAVAVPILDLYTQKHIRYEYAYRTHLSEGEIETSSLRFTWEYVNPDYYEGSEGAETEYLAVITPGPMTGVEGKIEGYRQVEYFDDSSGLFKFRSNVRIFKRN